MARMRMCVAAVVLLSLLSVGRSAPLDGCEPRLKPITLSTEGILGKWMFIGGSSDVPGSRSLVHLMSSVSLNVTETGESGVLNVVQSQRLYGHCSSIIFKVIFKDSTMLIEQPFQLKEVYLPTSCADCLVILEDIVFDGESFTSLMLFSKRQSVSPAVLEEFKNQVECLRMRSATMINQNGEPCQDDAEPSDGVTFMNLAFGVKAVKRVTQLLDSFFDMFVN